MQATSLISIAISIVASITYLMSTIVEHGRVLPNLDARESRRNGLALPLVALPISGDEPTAKLVS
jgi:hypothetical protein